jgi:hypothetical protein
MNPALLKDLQGLMEAELGRVRASANRSVLRGASGLMAGGVVLVGLVLAAVGVFLHLMAMIGPLEAGLWVGGVLIVLALAAAGIAMAVAGQRAKRRAEADAAIARSIVSADVAKLAAAVQAGGSGTMVLAGAALLAGIAAGRRRDG